MHCYVPISNQVALWSVCVASTKGKEKKKASGKLGELGGGKKVGAFPKRSLSGPVLSLRNRYTGYTQVNPFSAAHSTLCKHVFPFKYSKIIGEGAE